MNQLFRSEVADNKTSGLNRTIILSVPNSYKAFALIMTLITGASIFFLSTANYSKKESVEGILHPSKGLIKLIAQQEGVIDEVFVKEGETVTENQLIMRIRMDTFGGEGKELNQSLINYYNAQIDSLNQQLLGEKEKQAIILQNTQKSLERYQQQLENLNNKKLNIESRISIQQSISKQMQGLAKSGYLSELELDKQKELQLALTQQTLDIKTQVINASQALEDTRARLKQLPIEFSNREGQLLKELNNLRVIIAKANQQRSAEVRATANGIVTSRLVNKGQNVAKGTSLLSIIPEDSELQAILYLPTTALGLVKEGQEVKLRYPAFPYQRFGSYAGKIKEISKNLILPTESVATGTLAAPSFRIIVNIEKQFINAYGANASLQSGMAVRADIVLADRSLIEWLFDPIYSIGGQL